eukprot:Nk52_evm3s301 gene=Nk52_evmTU3s301
MGSIFSKKLPGIKHSSKKKIGCLGTERDMMRKLLKRLNLLDKANRHRSAAHPSHIHDRERGGGGSGGGKGNEWDGMSFSSSFALGYEDVLLTGFFVDDTLGGVELDSLASCDGYIILVSDYDEMAVAKLVQHLQDLLMYCHNCFFESNIPSKHAGGKKGREKGGSQRGEGSGAGRVLNTRQKEEDTDSVFFKLQELMDEDEVRELTPMSSTVVEVRCPWEEDVDCTLPQCPHNKPVLVIVKGSARVDLRNPFSIDEFSQCSSEGPFSSDGSDYEDYGYSNNPGYFNSLHIVNQLDSIAVNTLYVWEIDNAKEGKELSVTMPKPSEQEELETKDEIHIVMEKFVSVVDTVVDVVGGNRIEKEEGKPEYWDTLGYSKNKRGILSVK